MGPFVLLSILFAITKATPEDGYNYPRPGVQTGGGTLSTSYGVPSSSVSGGRGTAAVFSGGIGFNSSNPASFGGIPPNIQSGVIPGVGGGFGTGAVFVLGGGAGRPSSSYGAPTTPQTGDVQKHIYVYVAPEEEQTKRTQHFQTTVAQKHYKIIFIKAPSYSVQPSYVPPQQSVNEEKTLVYVLVKKPDDAIDIPIPEPVPTQPSKPEVYFIKYKTQKDEVSKGYGGKPPSTCYGVPGQSNRC